MGKKLGTFSSDRVYNFVLINILCQITLASFEQTEGRQFYKFLFCFKVSLKLPSFLNTSKGKKEHNVEFEKYEIPDY